MPEQTTIVINPVIMDKFHEEVVKLQEQKGEDIALELKAKISKIHEFSDVLLKALKFRSDERIFEILLRLLGYDKTSFDFCRSLDKEVAFELLDPSLTDKQFYFMIYSEIKFSAQDVERVVRYSKDLKDGDLERICTFIQNTGSRISISKFLRQFARNRRLISKMGNISSIPIEGLAMKLPVDCFKVVANFMPNHMDSKRLNVVANMWAKGEISDMDFFMILNNCVRVRNYSEIIHEANGVRRRSA